MKKVVQISVLLQLTKSVIHTPRSTEPQMQDGFASKLMLKKKVMREQRSLRVRLNGLEVGMEEGIYNRFMGEGNQSLGHVV